MKILLLSVLVVAMIGLLVPSAFALEDNGDFYLIFNSPNSHSDFFTKIINDVNQSYVLQQDIPIKFEKCGMANAFWNSGLKQITICEEYVSQTQKIFEKKFQNTSDMQKLWTNLAVSFVIYHEIGHSLVDEFNLPVIGREENFADSFAAHEMIETFGASSLIPPISRYFETSSSYHFFGISFLGFSDGMYADSHNLNEQRGYDLLCLAYGGMLTDEYYKNTSDFRAVKNILDDKISNKENFCKYKYEYNKYSNQITFEQYDPETVIKKNAYEKAKRDEILKAQSEAEELRTNAYNTLSFLYESRIPWVEERVVHLNKFVNAIDTVGAPSGISSTIIEGELYVPDEPTRLKINMGERVDEWFDDIHESYIIASNAYKNKEYRTALQYAEKSMEYSESGPELVEWLNHEIIKINKIEEEIRQEEIRQEEIRQEEIRQQNESQLDYQESEKISIKDRAWEKLNYVYDNFIENREDHSASPLSYKMDELVTAGYADDHRSEYEKMRQIYQELNQLHNFDIPELYDEGHDNYKNQDYESALYNLEKAEKLIIQYKIKKNELSSMIQDAYTQSNIPTIDDESLDLGKSLGIENKQDLFKKWNQVLYVELPKFYFSERLIDLHHKYRDVSGHSSTSQNNILTQRIDETSKEVNNIEKQILVVKEKLNHLMTPYNSEALVEIIVLENMIQSTDLYMKDMEQMLEEPIPQEYLTEIPDDDSKTQSTLSANSESSSEIQPEIKESVSKEGGGCLIATAAYGSEMAPQVQFLRELRDNTVLQTTSGTVFMTGFNQFYYSFSPAVADYERENPVFKEAVKVTLTPLLTSLTLLNYVEIDTEEEMLGYGIGVMLLNVGMYFVAPALVIMQIKKRIRGKNRT